MKIARLLLILVLGLILVACGSSQVDTSSNSEVANVKSQPTATEAQATQVTATQVIPNTNELVRTDNQGAVAITVEPLNLDSPGDTLTFEVGMNTHSVNLNMDLSTLAILSTDNGNSVQAVSWDGGTEGGHHVSGNLTFPAINSGKSILDGAKELTLIIKDVDAPERVFVWDLGK